ncbi:MAG TPA: hypothetical protein VM221_06435 [Armatimonadota bacterium]|nr:hypothetical protein [Armatimonadota bacterium]
MEVNDRTKPEPTDAARGEVRRWRMLALAAAAYLGLGLLAGPRALAALKPGPLLVGLAVVAGIAYILIALAMVVLACRLPLSWKGQLGAGLAFAAAFGAARAAHVSLLGDLSLVLAALFAGALASRVIRERNMLVPVVVAAAAVDTWGVYWGFVAEIGRRAPEVVKQFSAAVPGAAAAELPVPLLSSVGAGDFLFMALFVAAVWRLGMNLRGTLWALFGVYLVVPAAFAAVSAVTASEAPALPGLVFVGFATAAANWRHFHFSRAERFALLYAAMALTALILAAWGVKRALGG